MSRYGADQSPAAPRVGEWSPIVSELTIISDRVLDVFRAVAALGGNDVKSKSRPRPVTAMDRMRKRLHREQHNRLATFLLPNRVKEDTHGV